MIKIYDFGRDHESVYLSMELFAAPNLKQRINQGIEALAPLVHECIRQARRGAGLFSLAGLDPSRRQARQLSDERRPAR